MFKTPAMISEFPVDAKKFDNDKGNFQPIFYTRTSKSIADQLAIEENCGSKTPLFFHYWILIGYYSLCIPFKSSLELNFRSYILKTSKSQKVKIAE